MKFKRILFLIILLIPFYVNAAYARLKTENQSPIVNTEIILYLEGTYDQDVKEVHYKIIYDQESLRFIKNVWSQSSAKIDTSTPGVIYVDKDTSSKDWVSGNLSMLTFEVLKTQKTSIKIEENGTAYYVNDKKVIQTVSPITISAKEPNTVTTIGSLFVKGYSLSPTFSRAKHNYTLHVPYDVDKVEVVATKANETQTITGDGVRNLVFGDNKVRVIVKAQNGDTETYEIMITREDNRTSDVSLKKLILTNTDIKYEDGKYVYDTTVSKSVSEIFISATPNDSKATIEGLGSKKLEIGFNTFEIIVESSNGVTQTYTFNITRSTIEYQNASAGTELDFLKIDDVDIPLEDNKFKYLFTTDKVISEVKVDAITRSNTAKYIISGNTKLVNGANTITITVSDSNMENSYYYVYLYRLPSGSKMISNLNISYDQNTDDLVYLNNTDNRIIPLSFIKAINKNKVNFYYGITDSNNNLLSLFKINGNYKDKEQEVIFNKTSDTLPTFKSNIPMGVEITLYVGDIIDNQIVKIYSFNDGYSYREISAGSQTSNGYITFVSDGSENYIITDKTLVERSMTIKDYYEKYKMYVAIVLGLIIVILFLSIIKKIKRKRTIK